MCPTGLDPVRGAGAGAGGGEEDSGQLRSVRAYDREAAEPQHALSCE